MACLRGEEWGGSLYQFHTVGSGENMIPFHLSLSRCHSPPQVVIATQALTASSRFLQGKKRKEKNVAKLDDECIWKETKMTYRGAQTSIDAALHTVLINRENQSTMFILCYSRVFPGLVCKVLLMPIVIPIITFCYALEGQCKQSHA